jgi:phosphoserine phosphatase
MQELERFRSLAELQAAREEMVKWYEKVPRADLLSFIADATLASGAEEGVHLLKTYGVAVGIASVTWDFAVKYFADLLGVEYWLGTRLFDSGEIKHIWPTDKAHWAKRLREELRIQKGRMAAVGDSSGDIELLTTSDQAFYLGRDLPMELDGCVHLPNANILVVCEHILKRFSIKP